MILKHLLLTPLLCFSCLLQAQTLKKDNGYIVYTLGKDTTVIGHYQLTGKDFDLTIIIRTPTTNVHKLKGTFFSNGELQYAEGHNYKPLADNDSQLLLTYKLFYKSDSTYIEQKRGNNVSLQQYSGKAMIANSIGAYSILFLPVLVVNNYTQLKVGDSIISQHIAVGKAREFIIKKTDKSKLTIGSSAMGTLTYIFNKNGKLRYIDGIGSNWNLVGTTVPYLNMDSVITANLKREQLHQTLGVINKLDSVQATINTTTIKIRYSRPSVRGRVIFGEVVRWNRFWRTGANAATKITTDQPLYFNGQELPAGEYSIFTMPTQNGWTMMFNKEANIWGTDYNPEYDVIRIPMHLEHLPELTEMMTIEIAPTANGGTINVVWEKVKASVRFSVRE